MAVIYMAAVWIFMAVYNVEYIGLATSFKEFESPEFIAYLKYLLYWREPEYAKYIV